MLCPISIVLGGSQQQKIGIKNFSPFQTKEHYTKRYDINQCAAVSAQKNEFSKVLEIRRTTPVIYDRTEILF